MKKLQTILSDEEYEEFRKKCFNAKPRISMSARNRGLIEGDLK